MGLTYTFNAELWMYQGEGAWYFITLPKQYVKGIKSFSGGTKGFGSIRVTVSIDRVAWETSIFPDSKSGSYVLPIKKEIRQKVGIEAGDSVKVKMTIHP